MSEQKYNEVLEFIKSNLIPKNQFDESQNEILVLKSALENATNDLEKLKLEFQEQQMTIDIIKAERESLEAEKKAFEVKFNEVSLKLKQKTHQYDSLLKSKPNCRGDIETNSASTQTVKEEPKEIGIVNFASSLPAVKTGVKRANSSQNELQRTTAKRKKTSKSDSNSRITRNSTPKFTCEDCLEDWGLQIMNDHHGNPDGIGVPDPKQTILTFLNSENYKDHLSIAHKYVLYPNYQFCKETNCHSTKSHAYWPHGDIRCKTCSLSFEDDDDHRAHLEVEHADVNTLSKKQIYEVFLKHKV